MLSPRTSPDVEGQDNTDCTKRYEFPVAAYCVLIKILLPLHSSSFGLRSTTLRSASPSAKAETPKSAAGQPTAQVREHILLAAVRLQDRRNALPFLENVEVIARLALCHDDRVLVIDLQVLHAAPR